MKVREAAPTDPLALAATMRPRSLALQVDGLHKSYRLPKQRIDTLKERVAGTLRTREYQELHVLKGISFDVERGEFFGVVGRNGSGKSTLLKLIASIYRADRGRIAVAGRLAPFIELGVGFNPELDARENVLLNGVMMGLSPREAKRRVAAVIDFAELDEFVDLKVKNYSSGMLVRLSFSMLTEVQADILLVDEVLAVGDAAFQQKCFDLFADFHNRGRTIVLVTHDVSSVERKCDRALLIEDGRIEEQGDPGDVARRYLAINFEDYHGGDEEVLDWAPPSGRSVEFLDTWAELPSGERSTSFPEGKPIRLRARLELTRPIENPTFNFHLVNEEDVLVFAPKPFPIAGGETTVDAREQIELSMTIDTTLAVGRYEVQCVVGLEEPAREILAYRKHAVDFVVFGLQELQWHRGARVRGGGAPPAGNCSGGAALGGIRTGR